MFLDIPLAARDVKLVACNLCQRETTTLWLTSVDRVSGQAFDIRRCSHCALRYTNPRPAPEEIAIYYRDPAHPSWPTQILRRWLRQRRARWCATGLRPGRALEIGCGDGWMLHALREAGWDVSGTERSEDSAAHARSLGLDVRVGELTGCNFAAQSFDLVVLWHVLEHVHDPLSTLTQVRRVMRPSGRLVVAVPNADSWQARVAGRRWFHLDVPRHLYHLDPTTLNLMLQHAGFQVHVWCWASAAYELRGWWDLLITWARRSAVSGMLATLTIPLAIALVPVMAWRRGGAAMAVQALPVLVNQTPQCSRSHSRSQAARNNCNTLIV